MTAVAGSVAVLGSVNMDNVASVRRFPQPGETVMATAFARYSGGKGANQAAAAARAGATVQFFGAVGNDADGAALRSALERDRVLCDGMQVVDAPTGNAQILVDANGENQIVVVSGANAFARAPSKIEAQVLLAQLETPLDGVGEFFAAKPAGSLNILNAAPYDPAARSCFANADIIIVNETELAAYCGVSSLPGTPSHAADLARDLLAHPGQGIIVTLGGAGSITVKQTSFSVSPGIAAMVVDTTGAGDCFCGYLAAGLAEGRSLDASLSIAHCAAAMSIGRRGGAASFPGIADLNW